MVSETSLVANEGGQRREEVVRLYPLEVPQDEAAIQWLKFPRSVMCPPLCLSLERRIEFAVLAEDEPRDCLNKRIGGERSSVVIEVTRVLGQEHLWSERVGVLVIARLCEELGSDGFLQ